MKIVLGYPPNYSEIRAHFTAPKNTYYAYGDTLYNPDGNEVPEDIVFHESVHSQQQGNNPQQWWADYILNKEFRKSQEVEAFSKQLKFIKKSIETLKEDYKIGGAKILKDALEEMARNLSSDMYKLNLTYQQAYTLIRKYE
jgi:hypothetical protein